MDKKLKRALYDAYYAPKPLKKEAFLKQQYRKLGCWNPIALQIRYIQWWVWLLPFAVLGLIFLATTWVRAFLNSE